MYSSDDAVMRAVEYDSLFSFMVERYLTWSTRIFTDTIFMVLLRLPPLVWRVLDTCFYTLFALAVSYLANGEKSRAVSWTVVLLFLLYPFTDMVSAGWIITTCVYLWSAAAVAFALAALKKALSAPKERLSPGWWAVGIASSLLAGSQEQACAALIALSGLALIHALVNKRFHPLAAAELCIGLAMLMLHLLSPALPIRDVAEAAGWFPEFETLTFLQKLEMGFSSTMYKFLMEPNLVFLAFCAFLLLRLIQKKARPFAVLCGFFPLFLSIVFGFGLGFEAFNAAFPSLGGVRCALGYYGTNPVFGDWDSFLPLLVLAAAAASIVIALWNAFDNREAALLAVYALCVGTAVRMVLGFSPTIWGSGDRTFILLYFVFVYLAAMLAAEIGREQRALLTKANLYAALLAGFAFVQNLIDTNAIGQ